MSSPNVTSSKAKGFFSPDRSGRITRPGLETIVVHHAAGMPPENLAVQRTVVAVILRWAPRKCGIDTVDRRTIIPSWDYFPQE